MRLNECIICGAPIGGESTSWTHSDCVCGDGWDLSGPMEGWPLWAKLLKLYEERQRENEGQRIARGIEVLNFQDAEILGSRRDSPFDAFQAANYAGGGDTVGIRTTYQNAIAFMDENGKMWDDEACKPVAPQRSYLSRVYREFGERQGAG